MKVLSVRKRVLIFAMLTELVALLPGETVKLTVPLHQSAGGQTSLLPTEIRSQFLLGSAADILNASTGIFDSFILTASDQGSSFTADPNSAYFQQFTQTITNGVDDQIAYGFFLPDKPQGVPGVLAFYTLVYESELFKDITQNAIDLQGYQISGITFDIISFIWERPGSNPNRDGNWLDYSADLILTFSATTSSPNNRQIISSGTNQADETPLTSAPDSQGNFWTAWTEGDLDTDNNLINRDIVLGKITSAPDSFQADGLFQVTNDPSDQANPALAIDSSDNLYLVWQANAFANWDIYLTTSPDGTTWSAPTKITDSSADQTNPAIAIDSSDKIYIVYQDDQNSDKDIYIASSPDNFANKTQITSAPYDQTNPDIAIDAASRVYVVWADQRNTTSTPTSTPTSDIYGAASDSWTNIKIIQAAPGTQQTDPKIAAEETGTVLHFVWVDDSSGDSDIYYASSNGLPQSPLTSRSIIDPGLPDTAQTRPAIALTGYTGGTSGDALKLFASWQDSRNNNMQNIYVAELTGSGANIKVGDDGAGTNQLVPVIKIDQYDHPFLVWVNNAIEITYSGSTFIDPDLFIAPTLVPDSQTTTIGDASSLSITFPSGAYVCDIQVSVSTMRNPPKTSIEKHSMLYEFSPRDITFNVPVTITIPFDEVDLGPAPFPYWFDPLTRQIRTDGITDITYTPSQVKFKTTHFKNFALAAL